MQRSITITFDLEDMPTDVSQEVSGQVETIASHLYWAHVATKDNGNLTDEYEYLLGSRS